MKQSLILKKLKVTVYSRNLITIETIYFVEICFWEISYSWFIIMIYFFLLFWIEPDSDHATVQYYSEYFRTS